MNGNLDVSVAPVSIWIPRELFLSLPTIDLNLSGSCSWFKFPGLCVSRFLYCWKSVWKLNLSFPKVGSLSLFSFFPDSSVILLNISFHCLSFDVSDGTFDVETLADPSLLNISFHFLSFHGSDGLSDVELLLDPSFLLNKPDPKTSCLGFVGD